MNNLFQRAKYVVTGEDGASNIELIVWFSVVLVIATALFLFRDQIIGFITDAGKQVDLLDVHGGDNAGGGAGRK